MVDMKEFQMATPKVTQWDEKSEYWKVRRLGFEVVDMMGHKKVEVTVYYSAER